jgi:hypothetical protein
MKVEVSYYAETPAAEAKRDVIIAGFAGLEGLSRTAVSRKLNELKIRGGWTDELAQAGVQVLPHPRSIVYCMPYAIIGFDAELNIAIELVFDHPIPESFAAEVIGDDSGKWVANQLRFSTADEAGKYASDLYSRWTACRKTRVAVSGDIINARWKDGQLMRLAT